MDANERRMIELLGLVLDEICTDADREELADLLAARPQFARGIAEEIFVHSLLQWQSEDISECLAMEIAADAAALRAEIEAAPARPNLPAPRVWRSGAWIWALAATLFIAASLTLWQTVSRNMAGAGSIGEIVEEDGVFWSNASSALRDGRHIYPGDLQTNAGAFTLKFRSGPVVRVAGPAALRIESDMLVYLDRGQATADVPHTSKGFTMKTPVVNVIDQGTRFGVAVGDNGKTDVVVFEGRVDLTGDKTPQDPPTQLVQGEGVSIGSEGVFARLMQIQRDAKGAWWSHNHPNSAANVIREVRDNIPPSDGSKYFCYQITFHALADDVAAYADHPHQWNGMDGKGLPDFLKHADYVKTFNDYRYINDFEMAVELSQPADLYIFFDDRVTAPKWLVDQFEDTGEDVGIDEGPWEGIPDHVNAVGPGRSIDNRLSVWRRRCEDRQPVVLGGMGEITSGEWTGRTMYGIAATPLKAATPRN